MQEAAFWLVLGVGVAFTAFMVVRHQRLRRADLDLLTEGIAAVATVVRLRHDADSAEDDRFVLTLDVEQRLIDIAMFVPTHVLAAVQPGRAVHLRVDPRNPARAILDLAAMGF